MFFGVFILFVWGDFVVVCLGLFGGFGFLCGWRGFVGECFLGGVFGFLGVVLGWGVFLLCEGLVLFFVF